MAGWVLAAERAYIAAATRQPVPQGGEPAQLPRAHAAAGAVASHFLAVGAPRSLGLVLDGRASVEAAALSVEAHRTWFAPSDLRCTGDGAGELAARLGGSARVVELGEALACDIVCVHAPLVLDPALLRRGSHVNVLCAATLPGELAAVARVLHEEPGLGELAAGLVDGRALDELTVFVLGTAAIALAAVSADATRSPASPG